MQISIVKEVSVYIMKCSKRLRAICNSNDTQMNPWYWEWPRLSASCIF